MQYLMGVDIGGSVAKAAIYDTDGHELYACGRKMDTLTPQPEFCQRDPEQIRDCVYGAVSDVIKKATISGSDIAAIGVTGQANGLYMFKRDGTPVYPSILSSDLRAKEFIKRWNEDGTLDAILPKTRQILWAGQTSALVAWFAKYDPQILEQAEVFVTAKDYARFLLTGVFALETTEASSTSMMDLGTRSLSREIAERLGIAAYMNKFPEKLLESTEIGGYVTAQCAALTGLAEGTPVVGGLIDTVASIISQGIVREDQLGMIIGTWGVNTFITKRPLYSKDIFSAFYYCLPDYQLILEGSPTSATNLEWFIQTFLRQQGMTFCGYDAINQMVAESDLHSSILFLPFLYGTNVNIDAKGAFVGLKGGHGIADMLRAIYEGVVFCHMYHIDRLLKFRERPETVRIAGGGARSAVWMQIFADALGAQVEVSEAEELGAMGAAMVAGVGVGVFQDMYRAVERFTHISRVYQPDPEKHTYYQKKYALYRRLIDALDPLWMEFDQLGE